MRLIVTKTTVCDGDNVAAGQVIDTADADGKVLLQLNKAVKSNAANRSTHSDLIDRYESTVRAEKSNTEKPAKEKSKAKKKAADEAEKIRLEAENK